MSFLDKLLKFKKKPFKDGEKVEKVEEVKKVKKVEKAEVKKDQEPRGSGQYAHVILRPHISEKTAGLQSSNQYVFDVDTSVAKQDVACAVRNIYGVRPIAVRMIRMSGKKVRFGRVTGSTKAWKKAIVTLPAGKTIDVYKK